MKKFVYKMQNVLNIKYKIEDQEKTNYGIARARLLAEEKALENLIMRRETYQEKLRNLVNHNLKIREIMHTQEAVESMKGLIITQKQKVKREEQLAELARLKLNAAMVERKTQERMKEQAFDTYKLEFDAWERKEIDELVSFQYATKGEE